MKSPYLLAIVSGLLIGTSYIPFPPWAIFFCFVPLWSAWLKAKSARQVFALGWITQFVLTLIGFNWVSYTVHEFGHLPWPAAIAVLLGFCSISTFALPLSGVLWFFFVRAFRLRLGARVAAIAVFASIGERLMPMIFDWHFGYTWLWAGFPGAQLADVIGFIGLSSLGLAFNACVLWAWLEWRRLGSAVLSARWLAIPLLGFVVVNLLGAWRLKSVPAPDARAGFLLVQANIGNEEKLMAEQGASFRDTVVNRFFALTEKGVIENPGRIDFAVWPETAFPEIIATPDMSEPWPFKLRQRLTGLGTPLITGAYSRDVHTGRLTNSFFALSKDGRWLDQPYHKTMLLAFGEYFPGADLYPQVREWFPEVADFGRGPGPTVLRAGELRIGAQICYEGLFDWFTRGLALKGAQLIVNVTNDGWYGTWQQPYQHGWMTLARAIEVRRPLVRSTNTGISMVILADGTILERSPLAQEWQHLYEVPYLTNPPTTPFMTWGYWLIPSLLGLTLVGLTRLKWADDQSGLGRNS